MLSTPSGPKLHFWQIKSDLRVMQYVLIMKFEVILEVVCPVNQTLFDPAAKNKSSQESNSF